MKTNLCYLWILMLSVFHFFSCRQTNDTFLEKIEPGTYDSTWWNRTPVRLLQTNFPAIYGSMPIGDYLKTLTDASANAVLFNTGGITANYQTKLEYQYKNPYMGSRDFAGELIEGAHENDIKYIARFDFSKVHPDIAKSKPEWLYVGTNGKNLEFNNTVAACINGGYYQEYSFKILKEVIDNYDIDGIFFNMMGYTGSTYAGTNYGICQCENCKKRFKEYSGSELPKSNADENIVEYRKFQRETSHELYTKVTEFIKQQNPNLIVYNYNDVGTSWIASESGASMNPADYIYHATNNVKRTIGSYQDKTPVNLIMGFQAIGYRNIMSSPNLLRSWMLQDILHGAPVGFVVVGTLYHYECREFFPILHDLYGFHKKYEKLFTNIQAINKIALIQDRGDTEAQGMIQLLSEEHIMFDIINPTQIAGGSPPRKIDDYEVLILNNLTDMSDELIELIDNFVENGGKLIATGSTSTKDESRKEINEIRLKSLGVESAFELFPKAQATYLKVSERDKMILGQSKNFSLMMMHSDFLKCKAKKDAKEYFRLLPSNMYGPSEVTWYTEDEITSFPGVIEYIYGKGKTVFIPWMIGSSYYEKGNYAQRSLFLGCLKNLLNFEGLLETDASALVEMTHLGNLNEAFEWIGMINHSGFHGTSVREPVEIHDTAIRFRPKHKVKELRLLRAGISIRFKEVNGWIECVVPQIKDFEMLLCLY